MLGAGASEAAHIPQLQAKCYLAGRAALPAPARTQRSSPSPNRLTVEAQIERIRVTHIQPSWRRADHRTRRVPVEAGVGRARWWLWNDALLGAEQRRRRQRTVGVPERLEAIDPTRLGFERV